ncbi:hypothetical protein GCM10022215_27810 [Nocardioides fonticola]|uniref:Ig-like domain-containing protein n=1 Tax=Nocardioides fonticola TaxID=450363 RepID=A0ABP7XNB7_9ACTN
MPSRASATAAALGTVALAVTALASVSAPATGAPTTAEWTCDQTNTTAPYTATVPTTISVRRNGGGGVLISVTSSAGTPTGKIAYSRTTPFTSSAWSADFTLNLNPLGGATMSRPPGYYGYDPTDESVWCASATTTQQ